MIDASRGFMKDGPKNRLRAQDIHRIVDCFNRGTELPGYSRLVPPAEIERNGFNLNLPRYIESLAREDRQGIEGHLKFLNTPFINRQRTSKGQGDAVVHISAASLASIEAKMPSFVAEQTAIATVLSDMDAEIAALENKLAKARSLKQGMMQELLTGRIRLV